MEQLSRSVPRQLADTVSVVGLAPARVLTLARTILLQSQWVDRLRRMLHSLEMQPQRLRRLQHHTTATPTPTPTIQVTVQTSLAGLSFSVDGTPYTSAQTFSWVPGESHTIATTSPQNGTTGVRYAWSSWTDGGPISHTVTPTTNKIYTANFNTQYYLTMAHGTGGTVTPASGWKNSGTTVSISATPTSGYSFSNWNGSGTGSFSGTNNPASITMGGPITETATFTHN